MSELDDETQESESAALYERRLELLNRVAGIYGFPSIDGNEEDPATKPVKKIQEDKGQSEDVKSTLNYLNERRKAEIARLNGDNDRRKSFFNFVMLVTGLPIVMASAVMGRIAWDGDVSDSVLIAFFASVVVEVIGLAIIVANYLFPKDGSLKENAGHDPREVKQSDGKDD